MGKHTGSLSRLSLNYDYVFLAMIRSALTGCEPKFEPSRCMLHPTKKRAMATDDSVLEYCADVSAMLTYHKVLDNIADCRGAKKLAFMSLKPVCGGIYKRADSTSELGERVAALLHKMSVLEKSEDATPDMLADVFGQIMTEIFTHGLDGETEKRIAAEIGNHTGRYIYLADALDDAERDIKSGEFNPFVKQYGEAGLAGISEKIKTAVLLELSQLEAAINLVDFSLCPGYEEIVKNIIYLGMPEKIGSILRKPVYTRELDRKDNSKD